jgi:hypothetical protein
MRARSFSRSPSSLLLAGLFGLTVCALGTMTGCGGDTPLPLGTLGAACYSGGKGPCGRCNAELLCSSAGICVTPDPVGPKAVCPDAGSGDAPARPDGAPATDAGAPEVGADAPAAGHDGGGAAGNDGAADQATDGGGDVSGDAADGGDA